MKKLFLFIGAAALMAGCSQINEEVIVPEPQTDGAIKFIGTIDQQTKIATSAGASTWAAGDKISIFSVKSDNSYASTNVLYKATADGVSTEFTASDADITVVDCEASGHYYAGFPGSANYPSALKADESIELEAKTTASPIDDYRFFPFTSNSTQAFVVDPATGLSTRTNNTITFIGQGTKPANDGDPVALTFSPVQPILEFGFTGEVTLKQVTFEFVGDKTYNQSTGDVITGKGVVNIANGAATWTNISSTAAKKGIIIFRDGEGAAISVPVNETTPVRTQFVSGRFVATGGLKLSFLCVDADGNEYTSTKTIWTSKTADEVSMYDAESGKCKHIYQPVGVPTIKAGTVSGDFSAAGADTKTISVSASTTDWTFDSANSASWISALPASGTAGTTTSVTLTAAPSGETTVRTGYAVFTNTEGAKAFVAVSQVAYVPQAADYYKVNVASLNWDSSYVLDVKDADGNLIAVITKEYLGKTVDKQAIVAYPIDSDAADFTAGVVAEVTLENNSGYIAPTSNIHGGTLSMSFDTDSNTTTVDYSAGSNAAATNVYIKASTGVISLIEPAAGTVANGVVAPQTLTLSDRGETYAYALVKIGTQIWMAEDLKTKKLANGTAIGTTYSSEAAVTNKYYTEYNDNTYLYSAYTLGHGTTIDDAIDIISPSGWKLPSNSLTDTSKDWTKLMTFCGIPIEHNAANTNTLRLVEKCGTTSYNNVTCFSAVSSGQQKAASPVALAYPAFWASTSSSATNGGWVGFNTTKTANTSQAKTKGFAVRLVKE